jgi:hypothetical protein
MKQTLLENSIEESCAVYKEERYAYIGAILVTSALNIFLCHLRTDQNHYWLLTANVLLDVLCGWFLIYHMTEKHLVLKRMIRLQKGNRSTITAEITGISEHTQRIPGLNCFVVTANGRRLFLPERGNISLEIGKTYTLDFVDNVIVEARS